MFRNLSRRTLAFGIVAVLGLTGVAVAAEPASTGLGQAWPNAADVSLSPRYHVYVFVRDGIRYIQINDANGVVRSAVATADQTVLVLPVGVDASSVRVTHAPDSSATAASNPAIETVYRDTTTTITAIPTSNSTTRFTVAQAATCTDPATCSGFASSTPK